MKGTISHIMHCEEVDKILKKLLLVGLQDSSVTPRPKKDDPLCQSIHQKVKKGEGAHESKAQRGFDLIPVSLA